MSRRTLLLAALSLVSTCLLASTGCNTTFGPRFGIFAYPIPLSPYFQHKEEEKFWNKERYQKLPVMEPLSAGAPNIAMDPPSPDEVMKSLEQARPVEGGWPFLYEMQRNNVRIIVEPIADSIDPPRVYPLVGPCQLHHARYKCTVHFTEVTRVGWPVPYTTTKEDAQEVLYIDHDHLHMVGNVNTGSMAGLPPMRQ
jgi:hypothetical protein